MVSDVKRNQQATPKKQRHGGNALASNIDAKIAADSTRVASQRVGLANHSAGGSDDAGALPDHSADRARRDEVDELWEERLLAERGVVRLREVA